MVVVAGAAAVVETAEMEMPTRTISCVQVPSSSVAMVAANLVEKWTVRMCWRYTLTYHPTPFLRQRRHQTLLLWVISFVVQEQYLICLEVLK